MKQIPRLKRLLLAFQDVFYEMYLSTSGDALLLLRTPRRFLLLGKLFIRLDSKGLVVGFLLCSYILYY